MRTFVSYSTNDKNLAGKIKNSLKDFGFSSFLAHDDIKPTQPWIERILDELNKSDVFLPLLTKSFHKSVWTSQEVGIAIARRIFIISLKIDVDPEGFLAQYQALKLHTTNLEKSAFHIAHVVSENPDLRRQFLNDLIRMYEKSITFDEAEYRSSRLNLFKGYTSSQVDAILRAAIENDQIYRSWAASKALDRFIYRYKDIMNKKLIRSYLSKRS